MNNKALQVFRFEDQDIRTVEINGEINWVAKDICKALDITNDTDVLSRLDDDEVDSTYLIDSIGRPQSTNIVNESGLYSIILGSRKEEAKRFKKWVTSEVLPSIRKTGKYEFKQASAINPNSVASLSPEYQAAIDMAKAVGLTGNQALIAANRVVRRLHGQDCLELLGHTLVCDKQEIHFTATAIGEKLGITAQKVNGLALKAELITADRDEKGVLKYMPTEKGKDYCLLKDVEIPGKKTARQQLMYYSSAVEFFKNCR